MDWSQVHLPPLPERYLQALRAAVEYIFAEFQPCGIVVSGSDDFRIDVLHAGPWRRRVQKFFAGIPTRVFVNSREGFESTLRAEAAEDRPVTAHRLTSGAVIYNASPALEAMIAAAKKSLAQHVPGDEGFFEWDSGPETLIQGREEKLPTSLPVGGIITPV